MYKARCLVCHGLTGKGNGPGAAGLAVKPRDYTDAAWQRSVSDADLKAIISKGGKAVGKNDGMPPFADLKPEVVDGLVRMVRSFGPDSPAGE